MNKKPALILGIALVFLLGIALATSLSASSDVIIYAFDQNKTPRESMKAMSVSPFTTHQMKAWI